MGMLFWTGAMEKTELPHIEMGEVGRMERGGHLGRVDFETPVGSPSRDVK